MRTTPSSADELADNNTRDTAASSVAIEFGRMMISVYCRQQKKLCYGDMRKAGPNRLIAARRGRTITQRIAGWT
jgi:hypothetical protein